MIQLVTTFLAGIWDLFEQTSVPGLNLSFAQLYLGVFVVSVSIMILRPLLGIGASVVHMIPKHPLNTSKGKPYSGGKKNDKKSN